MADISILSRLINGVQRNVNLSTNTLVVGVLKVGATDLTETILGRLISLQNGTDVDATYHTHDGRYYTESELGSSAASSGSDLIGDDNTYSAFTPAAATVKGALSGINTELNNKIERDGSIDFTGDQSMGGFKLLDVAAPVDATDAANKAYVDAVATGLDVKASVRLATTAALPANTAAGSGIGKTLTATANAALSVDGVAVAVGNRILVKDESTAANRGFYTVTATGSGAAPYVLTRATDFDENAEVTAGSFTFVEEGTANADSGWVLTTDNPITVDTTGLAFSQFSGAGSITAGAGLLKTGNVIDVVAGDTSLTVAADSVAVNLNATGGLETSSGVRIKSDTTTANTIGVTTTANGAGTKFDSASFADSGAETLALAAGVAGAGLGLAAGVLSVNVDDSTVEINTDIVRVKDLGITAAKLATDSVTTVKILDANVTAAKLAADSVTTVKILDANVTAAKLAADSVTTVKILDANVTLAKLASGSVDENKLTASVAGAGLTGGAGTPLAVGAGTGIQVNANDVAVISAPRGVKATVAGEAYAANTSFLVRWAISGETAGRVYKADRGAATDHKFYAFGIALSAAGVAAAGAIDATFEGTHTLGSGDTNFGAGDIGKAVYLTTSGGFSITPSSTVDDAVWRIGSVQEVDKIWVGGQQLNGIN